MTKATNPDDSSFDKNDTISEFRENEQGTHDSDSKAPHNDNHVLPDGDESEGKADEQQDLNTNHSDEQSQIAEIEAEEPGPEQLAQRYLNSWRHTQADFENYKKRMVKEKEILAQALRDDMLYKLLPTIDHLELALQSAQEHSEQDGLKDGVNLILEGLYNYLNSYEVTKIESVGKPFNYNFQEAVKYEDTIELPDNHVIRELIPGYMIKDRVLRAAKVVLARHPSDERETGAVSGEENGEDNQQDADE